MLTSMECQSPNGDNSVKQSKFQLMNSKHANTTHSLCKTLGIVLLPFLEHPERFRGKDRMIQNIKTEIIPVLVFLECSENRIP